MAIKSQSFVGVAEGIKSHELSTKDKIEQLRGHLSKLGDRKNSLQGSVARLEAEIASAHSSIEQDGNSNDAVIAALEARKSVMLNELTKVEADFDRTSNELDRSQKELEDVLEEKEQTLFEIQERARKTSKNIAFAGGMYGAYSGVGVSLQNSMKTGLSSLSQAASILGGSVDDTLVSGGKGGTSGFSRGGGQKTSSRKQATSSFSAFTSGVKEKFGEKMKENLTKAVIMTSALSGFAGAAGEAADKPNQVNTSDLSSTTKIVTMAGSHDICSSNDALKCTLEKFNITLGNGENITHSRDDKEQNTENSIANALVDLSQVIESVGEDHSNWIEYVTDQLGYRIEDGDIFEKAPVAAGTGPIPPNPIVSVRNMLDVLKNLDYKVEAVPHESISEADAETFMYGEYMTVEATEDLTLYRVYGGGSEKQGNPNGKFIFLTSHEPKDRMSERRDSALSNKWQGVVKNENGELVRDENGEVKKNLPNTREFYSEVHIPKGTRMYIGKVAPQKTSGGQMLQGGGDQIIVAKEGLSFGEGKEMGFWGNYEKFEVTAKKIENGEV